MKKLSSLILLTIICASICRITAQNKPFTVYPYQVKNVYIGLKQNDSLKSRLSVCENIATQLDSIIKSENTKTAKLINEVVKLNSEAEIAQSELNKYVSKVNQQKKPSLRWYITAFAIGVASGVYIGGL